MVKVVVSEIFLKILATIVTVKVIRCSKIKVVRMVWKLNDYIDLIILNPTQLVSKKTDTVFSRKNVILILPNTSFFQKTMTTDYVFWLLGGLSCLAEKFKVFLGLPLPHKW